MSNKKIDRNGNFDIYKLIKKLKKDNNISEKELIELIKQRESDVLEFKQNVNRAREITTALSAFSNNKGGIVVIGVNDNKHKLNERIIGANIGYQSIENIVTCVNDTTDPKLYPIIKSFKVLGKNVVLIYINENDNKPVSAFKRFYKRVGNVSKQLDREEYERLMLERRSIGFDELINEDATMDDIDIEKVKAYVKKRAELKGIKEVSIKPSKLLKNINVTRRINKRLFLKNSSLLFFCKDTAKFIPHNEIKLARFKGTSMVEFIDRVELKTTLPEMVDEAEKFVRRNTKRATKIIGFKQQNIAEYPYEATREAIVNAVAHRDYNFGGTAIRVMIFDDRIEIESPGKLPKGVTLQNLDGSHVLRNALVANLLYDIGYIEKWGTGIKRMKDLMKGHGLKEPVFEQKDSFFRVVFYGPKDILELEAKEKVADLRDLGLNDRQISALKLMVNDGQEFTNKRYREMFGVSRQTATRDLIELSKKVEISERGKLKGRIYFYESYSEKMSHKMSHKSGGKNELINENKTQLTTRKNEDKNTDYEEDEEEIDATKKQEMSPKMSPKNKQKYNSLSDNQEKREKTTRLETSGNEAYHPEMKRKSGSNNVPPNVLSRKHHRKKNEQ